MLVISRRKGECIHIGNDIEVVVTEVSRKGVRLGIRAPRSTLIVRGEVRDAVVAANREAAGSELSLEDVSSVARSQATGVSAVAALGVKAQTPSEVAVEGDVDDVATTTAAPASSPPNV